LYFVNTIVSKNIAVLDTLMCLDAMNALVFKMEVFSKTAVWNHCLEQTPQRFTAAAAMSKKRMN
jgi:hypothetical protein